MTKMKRILSLLLAVLLVAGLILVPVSAEGESAGSDKSYQGMEVVDEGGITDGTSGLVMSKYLVPHEDGNHDLRLEVYTTGETVSSTIQVDAPTDIVLVLDQSSSMASTISTTKTTYTPYTDKSNSNLYKNKDNLYVKVGEEYKQVTLVETKTELSSETTYSYTEVSSNSDAYSNRDNLYTQVDGVDVKVNVAKSDIAIGSKYTYTYIHPTTGETVTDTGETRVWQDTKLPSISLYIRSENTVKEYAYTYTYTYTDASGKTVTLATIEGQNGTYAAATGTGTDGDLYSKTETASGTTTRLDALKTAVEKFAVAVAEKAKGPDGLYGTEDDVNHRIAVVGFATGGNRHNDDYPKYGNTELFIGDNEISYEAAPDQYASAFQDMSTKAGLDNITKSISKLNAKGATKMDLGIEMANGIFEANKVNTDVNGNPTRNRILIVFTDGVPSEWDGYDSNVANTAIANANTAKNTYGATVYTVGIFDNADENSAGSTGNNSSEADKGNYVCQQISSNNGVVPTGTAKKHYFAANNTAALNNIFEQISKNIESSTTSTQLGSETVVRDIVSSSFKLPDGVTADNITIETYACTGVDANGDYTWENNNDTKGATASISGDTVDVTGFDFKENYVYATNSQNARGSKLVITIPIQDNGSAFGEVSTNGEASGVYENKAATEAVALFKQPIVNFPYFTVVHVQSRVDTTGDQTGVVGKNYGETVGSNQYRVYGNTPFNLVDKVPDGYLYGGAFSTADCDAEDVQKFENGENALKFTPKAGAVYYIWEVPDSYLPANIYTMHKENGEGVTRIYMLTATDRALYREVGFDLGSNDTLVSGSTDSGIADKGGEITSLVNGVLYGTIQVTKMDTEHEEVYLDSSNGNKAGKMLTTNKAGFLAEDAYHDEGCIGGYRLPQDVFEDCQGDGKGFTFSSYWVTLDGIKVYGLNQAKVTYAYGNIKATATRSPNNIEPAAVNESAVASVQLMAFAPVAAVSDEAESAITLTVHDNGSVYTQGVDEELSYAGAEGQLFAGWFLDEACTEPVDFESISESTDVYAKYVSDCYLQVKYNKLGLFRVSGVSLVSAVDDPANYDEVGILVNGKPVSVSQSQRYMLLFTAASLFDGASRSDTLLTAQLSLSGNGSLEVTPYWVTLDGTTVYGQSRALTYTARSIQG